MNEALDILIGVRKSLDRIQADRRTNQCEFALANAMSVLVSVLIHERETLGAPAVQK